MSEQVAILFEMLQALAKYKKYRWCKIEFFADGSGYLFRHTDQERTTFDSPAEAGEMLWNLLASAYGDRNE